MLNHTNRLYGEKSPYLLQHAHNPVAWYPWGEEAFERARAEDKPVFLSIGYATCHWCHVMERESFEDEEIAALMNEAFICIKVDREERPDIDHIYMTVCQMMTGSGGWPLTIVMTPDRKPFYAATYIPPEGRYGRIGMKELIPRLSAAWKDRRGKVLESAGQITDVLAKQGMRGGDRISAPELVEAGFAESMDQYDRSYGGFGVQPKFPTPHRLVFMLRHGSADGLAAAEHTLEAMYRGGIFDHIGFGFHRYATDREWLVPHFEKMLYDQALLVLAYVEAYERTGRPFYAEVARKVLTYVQRDMTAPGGGFYSAEDADSEGEEGLFYTWEAAEMDRILGEDGNMIAAVWNIRTEGNFRDEATGQIAGRNIPHLAALPDAVAEKRLSDAREKLFDVREQRIHPLKDTKVLADWNGLMIAAFARAGRVLEERSYVETAIAANNFIETVMRREDGGLWHRWREEENAVAGQLEDYAFITFGLLELYEATFDIRYLETALRYQAILSSSFIDAEGGGYFMTSETAEKLIVRPKELYDGAIPSGNSVQLLNLFRLARLTGNPELEQQAAETGKAYSGAMDRSPSSFSMALTALQFAEGESAEIVVVGRRDGKDTLQMLDCIRKKYNPLNVVLFKDPAEEDRLAGVAPFTRGLKMLDGKATVYICRNFACERPINSLPALKESIK